jgi:hypothetical protein
MFCTELYYEDKWQPIGCWSSMDNCFRYINLEYDKKNFKIRYVDISKDLYNIDLSEKWITITRESI